MMKTHDKCDLPQAVSLACSQVDGTFGIAVVSSKYPEMLIGARRGSPLIVGVSKGEYFLSSDASAIVDYTSDVIYLEDNDMIVMTRNGGHEIRSLEEEHKDEVLKRKIHHLEISRSEIEKGGHKFFMIKEILDQPRTLQNCMRGRVSIDCKSINLGGLSGEPLQRLLKARRIIVCACGTSWHAGIVGEYLLEHLAGVSVEVEYASEFRYKKPVLFKDEDVVLVISQSGETADTLAAVRARCWSLRHIVLSLSLSLPLLFFFNAYTHTHTHITQVREAKRQGVPTLGIVNVVGSTIGRETDAGIYLHAGPEIGVASTKAFTGQVMVFSMLSILIGFKKGILNQKQYEDHVMALSQIPAQIAHILNNTSSVLEASKVYRYAQHMFFFGRGFNFPVALEGALKLKEISYIHAEGYAAAELKHGPIALIDASTPVVFVAPASDNAYEKIKANVLEASTQKAAIVVITEEDNKDFDDIAEFVFRIPRSKECFVPLLSVIPLQLLSYHIADMRGLDVDKPRNLAKSVTVE
jgi:glutamine---fructose-6-phosphate transaminase (isomerizing)